MASPYSQATLPSVVRQITQQIICNNMLAEVESWGDWADMQGMFKLILADKTRCTNLALNKKQVSLIKKFAQNADTKRCTQFTENRYWDYSEDISHIHHILPFLKCGGEKNSAISMTQMDLLQRWTDSIEDTGVIYNAKACSVFDSASFNCAWEKIMSKFSNAVPVEKLVRFICRKLNLRDLHAALIIQEFARISDKEWMNDLFGKYATIKIKASIKVLERFIKTTRISLPHHVIIHLYMLKYIETKAFEEKAKKYLGDFTMQEYKTLTRISANACNGVFQRLLEPAVKLLREAKFEVEFKTEGKSSNKPSNPILMAK